MRILINTSNYEENSGGVIVLHYLCHLLRDIGYDAYLVRSIEDQIFEIDKPLISLLKIIREYLRYFVPIKTNPNFNTPVLKFSKNNYQNDIVIYGEQVVGNPLNSEKVIRYLLHTPGYHTGRAFYGFNEYHVHWDLGVKFLNFPASKIHASKVKISYFFEDIYYDKKVNDRKGECYLIRKGKGKPFIHSKNAICIDGKSHEEIASIFQKSERFYSYDVHTMYSRYAAMCGCLSIVVPDEGVGVYEWNKNPKSGYAISYGTKMENIEKAKKEMKDLHKIMRIEKNEMVGELRGLIIASIKFFEENRFKYQRTL